MISDIHVHVNSCNMLPGHSLIIQNLCWCQQTAGVSFTFNDYMFLKCVLISEGQMFTREGIVFHNVKRTDSYSYFKLHC